MKAQKLWRSSLVVASLFSVGVLLGCSGKVGGPAGSMPPGIGAGTGSGGATGLQPPPGSGGATGSNPPPSNLVPIVVPGSGATLPAESAGPMVMRRLTYREYDHMLADLIGDTTAPAEGGSAWSPDAPDVTGYVTPNQVAELQVDLYNQTADELVETAIKSAAAGQPAGKLVIPCRATPPTTPAAETTCATTFVNTFGLEAYRRPITAAEQKDLLALFTAVRGLGLSFNESLGAMVKGMLQSASFLYHWEIGPTKPAVGSDGLVPLTSWQVASRLASALWETTPDDTLLQAAQAGQLSTPAQVAAQATRMFADPRAAQSLFNFHQQWLFTFGIHSGDLTQLLLKSSPAFTPAVAQGVQTEFSQFVSSVYTGDGTLQTLFTAPYTFANHDIAALYGATGPATGFAKVALDPTQRSGIFTQTAFLATLAVDGRDNPVYRGLSVYLKVLCGTVMPPPPNVPTVNFKIDGTTRQSYDAHGSSKCAEGCHNLFDPPGFAFENYDGVGAYRTTETGQPVDSTGTFVTPGDATVSFKNAVDLAKQLAASPEAQTCIDRQWSRYILGRTETMPESGSMSVAYQKAAATPGFSVRDMVTTLLSSKSFMYRQPSVGEAL